MSKCEHIIGINHDIDWADVTTLRELKEYIEFNKSKEVDIMRFNYCPLCGEKLDWDDYSTAENTI